MSHISPVPPFYPSSYNPASLSIDVLNLDTHNFNDFLYRCPRSENSLLLLNARSLLPKFHFLQDICSILCPSIICITETWLSPSIPDVAIDLPGYSLHRTDRHHTTGGGCAIYSKAIYSAQQVTDTNLSLGDSVWITLTQCSPPLLIGCVYNPPSSSSSERRKLTQLVSYVASLPIDSKILVGDFNLPDISWSDYNATPRRYHEFITQLSVDGWCQHVKQPTRGGHILDLVLTHGDIRTTATVCPVFPGSDHNMTYCILTPFTQQSSQHIVSYHPLSHEILEAFSSLTRSYDWTEYFLQHDTQSAANIFYSTIISLLTAVSPIKTKHFQLQCKPKVIHSLWRKLTRLRQTFLLNPDISILIRCHTLLNSINKAKLATEQKQEMAALFPAPSSQKLGTLFQKRCLSKSHLPNAIESATGELLTQPADMAEIFNKYFSSVYQASSSTLPSYPVETTRSTSRQLSSLSVSLADVVSQLRFLKASSFPGPDGIPPAFLKNGGPDIPVLLLKLFNLSLNSGVIPSQWKCTTVIPRWKAGSRKSVNSYRGIHHTPHIIRILERILKPILLSHFLSNDLISKNQYGFLMRRSTASCQYHFLATIAEAHNKGLATIIIYLDISKAFDNVPHSNLLHKLASSGIAGSFFDWITAYFTGRTQRTLISGALSSPAPVTSGVVQGSVLGPTLFLLYINDILQCIQNGSPFLFADDVKIVYSSFPSHIDQLCSNIKQDLESLDKWSDHSGLTFSTNKCHSLALRCMVDMHSFTLNNQIIPIATHTRDLGIHYNNCLSFGPQVLHQVSKARQLGFLILRSFHNRSCKVAIFKQHVRPILEYCCFISTYYNKSHRLAIENVQRKFTKALFAPDEQCSYRTRCEILNLDPLWLRRLSLNLTFFHSLLYNHCHTGNFRPTIAPNPTYPLRNSSSKILITRSRTSFHQFSFLNFYSSVWNRLPYHLRSECSKIIFKKRLLSYLNLESVASLFSLNIPLDQLFEQGPSNV